MAQYSCKWNSHASNMLTAMDSLKGVENFVDVTLMSEGRALKAHKLVLSTCSPLFHQMFLANPCSHPIVFLADLKFTTLKAIVDFIYKGEVSFVENELELLLKAAKALEIKGLTDVCREKLIAQAVDGDNNGKGPSSTPYRSPRKKRPRMQSGEVHVQFDDTGAVAKEDDTGIAGESDLHAENGSTEEEDESRKPVSGEPNVRIKQALRTLCSAKKMSVKEKQKITGDPLDRRTSFVWNFFTPIDNTFALCKTCHKKISRKSSISNLKKHLENRHSNIVLQSFSTLVESNNSMEQQCEPVQKEEAPLSAEQESEQAVCMIDGTVCSVERAICDVTGTVIPYDNESKQGGRFGYPKLLNRKKGPVQMRRRRSRIWNFFTPIDTSVARCDTCMKEMSYRTSISNLKGHLQSMHPLLDMTEPLKNSVGDVTEQISEQEPEEHVSNPVIHKL